MAEIKTGGSAFPHAVPEGAWGGPSLGMSLRDYFAGQALAVMCASNVNATGTFATPTGRETVASVCYEMADAMLKAREVGNG